MKSWLKGGLIGAGFFIITYILLFLVGENFIFYSSIENLLYAIAYPIKGLIQNLYLSGVIFRSMILLLLILVIYFFIIGAIIGWIVGKIKAKKK